MGSQVPFWEDTDCSTLLCPDRLHVQTKDRMVLKGTAEVVRMLEDLDQNPDEVSLL